MNTTQLIAVYDHITVTLVNISQKIRFLQATVRAEALIHKSAGDVASQIDRDAEVWLREALLAALPGSGFLGEEGVAADFGSVLISAADLIDTTRSTPIWLVDPIDGSANYVRGYPHYSVSVALVMAGEPVLGITIDPSRGEVFHAVRGGGAFLNGQLIRSAAQSNLIQCTAATVFPKPKAPFMDAYLAVFGQAIKAHAQVRRSGSMALDLAYLAAGRVDTFWERGMGAWDAAAGIVLLREAGAQVWAVDGLPLLASQYLAASTPSVRGEFEALLT
jgi:myo-inositol-1(or 4)-monophosphatase